MALDKREFEQFMTQADIRLTGASQAGIKVELYDVLKEFFKDSNTWREDISFTPQANTTDYTLTPLEEGQIIRLVGAFDFNAIPVPAVMEDFGTLKLIHPVSVTATQAYFARVIKNVTLPTTRDAIPIAPDWTLRVYEDVILDGLCGRMMAQQAKSYSNPQQSRYHLQRFRTGIQIARTAAARANLVGGQEWCYPRQGIVRGTQRGGVSTAWPSRAF